MTNDDDPSGSTPEPPGLQSPPPLPPQPPPEPAFPAHDEPRVWLISSGDSPIGITVSRQVLEHGDYVVSGLVPASLTRAEGRREQFTEFMEDIEQRGWKERFRPVALDIRRMGECQAAVAEAVRLFGRVDILLCCTSQAVLGTVEEFGASNQTLSLVRDQFESNYFGPVNIIKAVIPEMRRQKKGHILVLSGISMPCSYTPWVANDANSPIAGHIGTPGLGVYCASEWALEGFCDSIAYEIAPFNIKVSILQSSVEIRILTNLITSVPPIYPAYSPAENHAPLFRHILDRLLWRLSRQQVHEQHGEKEGVKEPEFERSATPTPFSAPTMSVVSKYPPLTPQHIQALITETVHAITAVGGHVNPPSRHIIGEEGVAAVKEKLKTVSEELEDFVQASYSVNVSEEGGN